MAQHPGHRRWAPWWMLALVVASTGPAGCASGVVRQQARRNAYAVRLAQDGLWNEARFQWDQLDAAGFPKAILLNNQAIGLLDAGRLEEGERMLAQALELDPGNRGIRGNLDRLREFLANRGKRKPVETDDSERTVFERDEPDKEPSDE